MSDMLRKRGREPEALPDSNDFRESKRFNGEEMDMFRDLELFDKTLATTEEACGSSEGFVNGVMRSLEEEISSTWSTFYDPVSGHNSFVLDVFRGHESQNLDSDLDIDLCYLLQASDDELGIPSSPVVDSKDEFCQSAKETLIAEGLSESPDLKCQAENWDFEDEFENCAQQFAFEDAWGASQVQDYMNRDFLSPDLCFDGDVSAAWTLEMAGCM